MNDRCFAADVVDEGWIRQALILAEAINQD